MKSYIVLAFFALVLTACASKENVSQAKLESYKQEQQQYSFRDDGGSAGQVR